MSSGCSSCTRTVARRITRTGARRFRRRAAGESRRGRLGCAFGVLGGLDASAQQSTSTEVGHTVAQFIYTLEKARKAHGDKVVLDNVTLNFLPGVKIGVVGPNGAGKSSLLRIMAGLDQVSNGEARLMPGYTVGMLAQEPPLNEEKTVLGNIEEAVAETKAKLERFNKIAEQMATD